jgi:hypothetical protein
LFTGFLDRNVFVRGHHIDSSELKGMANPEHLKILKRGVEEWNQWREANPSIQPDLSEAYLSETDLSRAKLIKANLLRAKLTKADLRQADLDWADLRIANLIMADLTGASLGAADLTGAVLRETDLSDANLITAKLYGAKLRRANLRGANLFEANLGQADLFGADLHDASLRTARLMNANLDGANLTGACLWETQRAGWSIKDAICKSVFWDEEGKDETFYSPGEFERLFADKTRVKLLYKDGINPIEIATIPALIKHLENLPGGATRVAPSSYHRI